MINGQPYNVKIVAVYASGEESLPSLVSTATPGTASAPSGLTAVGGNQKLTISFTPPAFTGGFDVLNYSYDVWPSTVVDHTENWQALAVPKASSPIVIPGLVNDTAYKFKLRAENATGPGKISPEAQGTPKAEAPSAPTITNVSAGNTYLTVAFTPPDTDGGKPITSYKYSVNNGATKLTYASTESPIDIENLTNGTKYSVILYAVNEVGVGAPSTAVEGLPAEGSTPSAPKITQVTAGIKQLSLDFTPPVKTNGHPITRYQYKLNSGRWTARNPETALTSPMILSGLANNTSYKVQIRAVNASGAGAASAIALETTPKAAPSHPKILLIDFNYSYPELGRTSANFYITFTPPDDGGSPITSYRLSVDGDVSGAIPVVDENAFYNPQGDLSYFRAALVPPPSPQGTRIGYLRVFDSAYNMFERLFGQTWFPLIPIKLQAENALGSSEWSPIEIFTEDPEGPPLDAPTDVTITVLGSTSIRIDFTPPTRTLTQPIVGYQYSLNDGLTYSVTVEALNNTITVTDLLPGSAYDVKIKGVNNQDFAAASTTVRVLTDPEIPTAPIIYNITGLDNTLIVKFSPPAVPGGVILDYEYSIDSAAYVSSGLRSSPITLTGTTNDILYTVAVRAVNQVGPGASDTSTGISGKPSEPAITSVQASKGRLDLGGELKVYFDPPLSNGGSPIIKYHYSIDNGVTYISILNTNTIASSISPITITNLVNGQNYPILLKAENMRSIGEVSQPAIGKPYTLPGAPTITQVAVDTSKIGAATAHFTPPVSDGGSPILSYDYSIDGGTVWRNSLSAVSDNYITFNTPTYNSAVVDVLLRAINTAGAGRASNRVRANPITQPSPPRDLVLEQVTGSPTQLAFKFNPPVSDGGSAITHYSYTVSTISSEQVYILASQLTGPLPYTLLLPNTFNYGTVSSVTLKAINFGAYTQSPITSNSGVSSPVYASVLCLPYNIEMPTAWVQLKTIQYNGSRFRQPVTLKLPCNPNSTYIGSDVRLMQPYVTNVNYSWDNPSSAGSGTLLNISNFNNIRATNIFQRTYADPPGVFTFTPDLADLEGLIPDRGDYEITFTAYNKYTSSPPYKITTRYSTTRKQLVTAPAPGSTTPPDYIAFDVINSSYTQFFSQTGLLSLRELLNMVVVEIYIYLENAHITYTLSHRRTGYNTQDGFEPTSNVTQEITLPIASDYQPYYNAVLSSEDTPFIYEVLRKTTVPERAIYLSAVGGLPFEGNVIAGGKQMLTLKILGFAYGDEVKLSLTARNSAGVAQQTQTIVLNTTDSIKANETYAIQPVWWACRPLPPTNQFFGVAGGGSDANKQTNKGYLTIMAPYVDTSVTPHKEMNLVGSPLTLDYAGPYYYSNRAALYDGKPTYLTGGGCVRTGIIRDDLSEYSNYYDVKFLAGSPREDLEGFILAYDIELYNLPSNLYLGWRFRGENDLHWRWCYMVSPEQIEWMRTYSLELLEGVYDHSAVGIAAQVAQNPNFPKVWRHDSIYLKGYTGINKALLRITIQSYTWQELKTNGAKDVRQLEFITCTDISKDMMGIPTEGIGPIVPYYFNLSDDYVATCFSSPPVSSGRVSVDVPQINYDWDGLPAAPYVWDGYWTPTPFQTPTTAQINAFKARYPKYFNTASSEGGEGGGGAGGPGGN